MTPTVREGRGKQTTSEQYHNNNGNDYRNNNKPYRQFDNSRNNASSDRDHYRPYSNKTDGFMYCMHDMQKT